MTLLARNPDLVVCWDGPRLLLHDVRRGFASHISADLLSILDLFDRPLTPAAAARRMRRYDSASVLTGIESLRQRGFLLPAIDARRRGSLLGAWRGNPAAALYHMASRDKPYLKTPAAIERFLTKHVATKPRPRRYKHYRRAVGVDLPRPERTSVDAEALERVLRARRTVRKFSRKPVELEDLAAVVRGTWGETGWLDGGPLGRFTAKTSPSAGALHPVECYVLAWNVRGLVPGLYHYDVKEDALRRLRAGNFREAAVRAASGQRWVGTGAFLCVMTAVFSRTLWKYSDNEVAYRVLWLDAGHLCQTFDLLATARGLGPFQTAAMQDSYIEGLIGVDGVHEFALYLCGAGVPRPLVKEQMRDHRP